MSTSLEKEYRKHRELSNLTESISDSGVLSSFLTEDQYSEILRESRACTNKLNIEFSDQEDRDSLFNDNTVYSI